MNKFWILIAAVAVVGMMATPAALAKGKKEKAPTTQTVASDVYAKYDVNANGILDADEKAALLKDFAKDAEDFLLKPYDTNSDKKLSDDEIAAIPATKTVDVPAPVKEKKHKKNK